MKESARFLWFKVPVGMFAFIFATSAQSDAPTPHTASIHTKPAGAGATATVRADAPARTSHPVLDRRPHYKVEALGFHAVDEVGWDSPWFAPWISDEVIVGIEAPGATTVSRIFGDVDAGESRSFEADESCILPIDGRSPSGDDVFVAKFDTWTCSNAGTPGPFSFTVVMVEEDSGFFHDCFSELPFGGCSFEEEGSFPGKHDDLIGRRTLEFTAEELAAAMPHINDTFDESIKLGPCFDERGCVTSLGTPNDAEYTFTYRLTRLPGTFLGPISPSAALQPTLLQKRG